jgi:hypothetical protein
MDGVACQVSVPRVQALMTQIGGGLCYKWILSQRYSPHQIKRHKSKVQAPAPQGASRLVKGLSHTALRFLLFWVEHTHIYMANAM